MGKKKASAPPPPDPYATAAAQGAANQKAAIAQQELNMVDQYTPYGTVRYQYAGTTGSGNPRYRAVQSLSPTQQKIFDQEQAAKIQYGDIATTQLGNVEDQFRNPIPMNNTREAAYDAIIARNQGQLDRQREKRRTDLINQGFTDPNSQAYRDAFDDIGRQENDFLLAAQREALAQEAQQFSLDAARRNQTLNELQSLLTGTQVQNPNFVNTPQASIGAAPIADSIYSSYQGDVNRFNQEQANRRGFTSGLFNLVGTGAGAAVQKWSDYRLKTDIEFEGTFKDYPVYSYQYIWGGPREVGVLAQEVLEINPDAVVQIGDYYAVDYGRL